MAKHKFTNEERIAKSLEVNSLRGKMTVPEACKKVGISPFNYANWKHLAKGAAKKTTHVATVRQPTVTQIQVKGSTDLMFIGFGKSDDVLQALNNLSTIFNGRSPEL